jgi:predicted RecB family endonuclease
MIIARRLRTERFTNTTMSYDISVTRAGEVVKLSDGPHHFKGGTFPVAGGQPFATLNMTYNYRPFLVQVFGEEGIRSLYGKTCVEVIPLLSRAVEFLGTERTDDYWAATAGNVGAALNELLQICQGCEALDILTGD